MRPNLRLSLFLFSCLALVAMACSSADDPTALEPSPQETLGAHPGEETEPHDTDPGPDPDPVEPEDATPDAGGMRPDASATDAGKPADAGTPKPPHLPLLKAGLHPDASDALRVLGVTAGQIIQTIGSIPASAGTHEADGTVNGLAYAAATDLSVKGMTDTQIRSFLTRMTVYGFAGWYRRPGFDGWPSSESPHMHVIFTGAPMKRSLRDQCRDFFVNKNGLVGHAVYTFLAWPLANRNQVKAIYAKHNPLVG